LKPTLENNKYDINFNFNEIEIQINECSGDQIKMIDINGNEYCEAPICKKSCPVGVRAKCISLLPELNENSIMKNKCLCNSGWKGADCGEENFVNFR